MPRVRDLVRREDAVQHLGFSHHVGDRVVGDLRALKRAEGDRVLLELVPAH